MKKIFVYPEHKMKLCGRNLILVLKLITDIDKTVHENVKYVTKLATLKNTNKTHFISLHGFIVLGPLSCNIS